MRFRYSDHALYRNYTKTDTHVNTGHTEKKKKSFSKDC